MIKIGQYNFEGPFLLSSTDFVDKAAIYAILCNGNSFSQYKILYIGESGEVGTRLSTHNKKECWKNNCRGNLYVSVLSLPSSSYSKQQRLDIETSLIRDKNPVCNKQ